MKIFNTLIFAVLIVMLFFIIFAFLSSNPENIEVREKTNNVSNKSYPKMELSTIILLLFWISFQKI